MSKNILKKQLADLKSEINRLKENDKITREKMSGLISEIEHMITNPEDSEHKSALIENLKNHIENFEIKHPDLTGVLNRIMVMLSNIGI
jgi:archaellum component FlaC